MDLFNTTMSLYSIVELCSYNLGLAVHLTQHHMSCLFTLTQVTYTCETTYNTHYKLQENTKRCTTVTLQHHYISSLIFIAQEHLVNNWLVIPQPLLHQSNNIPIIANHITHEQCRQFESLTTNSLWWSTVKADSLYSTRSSVVLQEDPLHTHTCTSVPLTC